MRSSAARRVVWFLALLIGVLGLLISFVLALEPYKVPSKEKGPLDRLCTAFATSSCEKVSKSRWGWFPPQPAKEETKAPDEAKESQEESADPDQQDRQEGSATQPAAGQEKKARDSAKQDSGGKSAKKDEQARIPSGELGFIYFSFIVAWLGLVGYWPVTRVWPQALFLAGSLLGAIGSGVFEYVMWTELENWCPLCVAAHTGSFLMPIFALLLWPRRSAQGEVVVARPAVGGGGGRTESLFAPASARADAGGAGTGGVWPTNWAVFASALVAMLLSATGHFIILNEASRNKVKTAEFYRDSYKRLWEKYNREWQHQALACELNPQIEMPIADRPFLGPADAFQTVVVWSDFECPSCRKYEQWFRSVIFRRGQKRGGLKYVFKHFPLDKKCNDSDSVSRSIHPKACDASLAAEAARIVGGDAAFWKMHDLLFHHQQDWKKTSDFTPYARQIGLDLAAFNEAMKSSEAWARIREDIRDGDNLGEGRLAEAQRAETRVNSTPTVFLNGRRFDSPGSVRAWDDLMEKEWKQRLSARPPSPATRPAAPPPRVP